jgi:hypothetical protein
MVSLFDILSDAALIFVLLRRAALPEVPAAYPYGGEAFLISRGIHCQKVWRAESRVFGLPRPRCRKHPLVYLAKGNVVISILLGLFHVCVAVQLLPRPCV